MPKTLDITRILREQKEQLRAGFQDRLVMTTSITLRVTEWFEKWLGVSRIRFETFAAGEITLRKYDATACIIFTELRRCGSMSLLIESTVSTPPEDRQARLSGAGRGYLRRKAKYPSVMHTVHFYRLFNIATSLHCNAVEGEKTRSRF